MTNGTAARKIRKTPQKPTGPGQNYVVIKHFEPSVKSGRVSNDEQSPIPLVNALKDEPLNHPKKRPPQLRKPPPGNVQGVTAKNPRKVGKSPLKSSSSSSLESKLQKFTNKYTVRSRSSQDLKPISKNKTLKSVTDPKLDSLKQEILENKLQQRCSYAAPVNVKPVEDLKAEIYQTRSSNMQHKKMLITELRSEIAQYKQFSSFQVYNSYEKRENGSRSSESEVSSLKPGTAVSIKRSSELSLDKAELSNLLGCSVEDSISDDLIKNKIQEANLLIERVKKALNKIKAIKGDFQIKSSSTDNEETEQDLKQEGEEVIEEVSTEKQSVRKKVCSPGLTKRSCQAKTRLNKSERPKTRRNEADDNITEDVARNKFRTVPEERHLNVSGSFVELQTKLQTISESTESDHSIPTKKDKSLISLKLDKEVQATPCFQSVGISPDYSRETKEVQTSPIVQESKGVMTETDVKRCQIECLPILEILPLQDACVCQKCNTVLTKENLTGLSICSKPDKLQKLAVQVLPPVVIPESMTLTPVLHLSISPSGHTKNHVKNSRNVVFISNSHNSESGEGSEGDEEQKKLLWCKSYQIYDNPNNHDPGELNKESLGKIAHLDSDFYRAFINPEPILSESRMGFVSKSTQYDWDDQDLLSLHRPKKINFSILGDDDVDNTSFMEKSITSNIESTITVLRLNPNLTDEDEGILNPLASKFVMQGSFEENQNGSSPSEITVTMSYSLSSDEKPESLKNKESKSSDEVQLKVTEFEKDERVLTAKDATTIKQIRDKLESLDASEKPYYQPFFEQFSSLDAKKANSKLKNPTINYTTATHLELGPNGRYKDEEHLFSQIAYPKIQSTFEHRDVDIAGKKLLKLPPRPKKLDTSNSDTITTNSQMSEGELLCKHSVSHGELHQCHYRPIRPRNVLTNSSRTVRKRSAKKIDFRDPSVRVELRRNYFNNWVTYYVKPEDVYESTVSGSSSSK